MDACLGHTRELDELFARWQAELEALSAQTEGEEWQEWFDFDAWVTV